MFIHSPRESSPAPQSPASGKKRTADEAFENKSPNSNYLSAQKDSWSALESPISNPYRRPPSAPATLSLRTPGSKQHLSQELGGLVSDSGYLRRVDEARQRLDETGLICPPCGNFIKYLEKLGTTRSEVESMFAEKLPFREVLTRPQAVEQSESLSQQHSVQSPGHRNLSAMRKKHLTNVNESPVLAALSPGVGPLSTFAKFLRERHAITAGRNIAIAIARDPDTREMIYTVASTDGPPGGTHSELLAWDALPDSVKDAKSALIYTERQPCRKGSNCNAKLKRAIGREAFGESVFVVYSKPQLGMGGYADPYDADTLQSSLNDRIKVVADKKEKKLKRAKSESLLKHII